VKLEIVTVDGKGTIHNFFLALTERLRDIRSCLPGPGTSYLNGFYEVTPNVRMHPFPEQQESSSFHFNGSRLLVLVPAHIHDQNGLIFEKEVFLVPGPLMAI
jgi:hypothetical protein